MNQALQIRSALTSEQLPPPSQAWLQTIISQQQQTLRNGTSLQGLVETARTRLLAADLTMPGLLDPSVVTGCSFPPELVATNTAMAFQETRLARDVVVQVLDLENLAQSRWQQVQELEAIERGEQKRGREIIRVVDRGEEEGGSGDASQATAPTSAPTHAGSGSGATHRLVLQDGRGQTLYGLELVRIYHIGIGRLSIGEKLLLRSGTIVARGVVLLEPLGVRFLGGRIDSLHKTWADGQLARLRESIKPV